MNIIRSPFRAAVGLAAAATLALGATASGAAASATAGCILRAGASCHDADLSGQDLRGRDLRRIDLTGATLRGTDFIHANLEGAILKHADLRSAKLERANLTGANLEKADLENANVHAVTAPRADLRHAKVRGANLTHANLQGAALGGADATAANFGHAHVQNASFHAAELHLANVAHASFGNTNFDGSGVRGIILFPSRVGDDATARRGLFFYVYLHLDAYGGHGHCGSYDGTGAASHRDRGVYCYANGDSATTIPAFRGARREWGWHDYGQGGYFRGSGDASLDGDFNAPGFGTFAVKHIRNLGLGHTYLPTGGGAPGTPGGPFAVVLTSRTYTVHGSFRYGYIQRLSGYLQRAA